jgi:hypothetical protein
VLFNEIEQISVLVAHATADFNVSAASTRRSLAFDGGNYSPPNAKGIVAVN